MNKIISWIKSEIIKKKWRKNNKHNRTFIGYIYGPESCVSVGNESYGVLNVSNPNEKNNLKIGNYCSIAGDVKFLLGADHPTDYISTFPFKSFYLPDAIDAVSNGDIVVDDDVWIGENVIILSGVHIGQGAVIAAGAVVTKDISPYAIAGGVPAKVIKYRFDEDMINELLKVDYSKLTGEQIQKNMDALYKELKDKKQLEWMPKK